MSNSSSNSSNQRVAHTDIRKYNTAQLLFRGRYQVHRILGRGGFGVTYLAQNTSLPGSPSCVIKQLCPKTQNPRALERAKVRFRREAQTLASLGSHSQIPRLLDYFVQDGEFFLVQEFIDGQTLAKEPRRLGLKAEEHAKSFLREIVPVVRFIHKNRIIHRDIKPPNIIRSGDDNRLVLIDFGAVRECLSQVGDDGFQSPATQFVGTPGFSPPEQLAMRPCFASDIYALGMTCLYLLSGKTPGEFDVDVQTGQVQWQKVVQVTPYFEQVLKKMLAYTVQERYQTVEQLDRALSLEPYLSTLEDCMSTRPLDSQGEEPAPKKYTTRAQRQAAEIRRLKARRDRTRTRTGSEFRHHPL